MRRFMTLKILTSCARKTFMTALVLLFPPSKCFVLLKLLSAVFTPTHEHFEPHFNRFLPNPPPDSLECDEQGKVKLSFVNLLHLLRRWWCWMRRITLFPIYRVKYCNALIRLVLLNGRQRRESQKPISRCIMY